MEATLTFDERRARLLEKANQLLAKTDYSIKSGGMRDSEALFYLTAALLDL